MKEEKKQQTSSRSKNTKAQEKKSKNRRSAPTEEPQQLSSEGEQKAQKIQKTTSRRRRHQQTRPSVDKQQDKKTAKVNPKTTISQEKKQKKMNKKVDEPTSPEELKELLNRGERDFKDWDFLSDAVRQGILKAGFQKPTPVQSVTIDPALDLRDMVVQAKTGTGKTAAFGIPLLELCLPNQRYPQALILTPTRELARQVADELDKLGKIKGVKILAIYGGIKLEQQIRDLKKGADIVVGTPGRLLDHINRKTLNLSKVRHVVLDEADEMLSMGFYMEVASILEACTARQQLMLFSATIPADIEGLVRQFLDKPVRLMVSGDDRRVEGIDHLLYFSDPDLPRPRNMLYIIEDIGPEKAIIFCNTRNDSMTLASYLVKQGKYADHINGDMSQVERENVLEKLRKGELQFLVATDLAARGIDIPKLTHVFNFNFPQDIDVYLHRIGRTGRQGKNGIAVSLVDGADIFHIMQLKRLHKILFKVMTLPPPEIIVQRAASRHVDNIFREALGQVIEPFLPLADALKEDKRGRYIVAYLLKLYHEEHWLKLQEMTKKEQKEEKKGSTNKIHSSQKKNSASKSQLSSHSSGSVRIYFSVGTEEGYTSDSLRQMIRQEASLSKNDLGAVQMERHHSFVYVNAGAHQKVLDLFQDYPVGHHKVNAKIAPR